MKKLLLIGALLCVLCSCGSGNSKKNTANVHEGHEWVDLGLPSGLKWATCNVGASSPEEYGDYFAWGETSPKSSYTLDNSVSWGESWGDISGELDHDAARANWGGRWRMPTRTEFQELIENCEWAWSTRNGCKGYVVTSKQNGNTIFLPAAGSRYESQFDRDGVDGYYWTSKPYMSFKDSAYSLCFYEEGQLVYWAYRFSGRSVRPVLDE
jgi:hypothetical protein